MKEASLVATWAKQSVIGLWERAIGCPDKSAIEPDGIELSSNILLCFLPRFHLVKNRQPLHRQRDRILCNLIVPLDDQIVPMNSRPTMTATDVRAAAKDHGVLHRNVEYLTRDADGERLELNILVSRLDDGHDIFSFFEPIYVRLLEETGAFHPDNTF
jgi:hypothetical protein